ncbi:MAG: hypothetical protein M1828_002694 [Chrysothrix sp. TS-e1954]|nr:MAG: hypothetical protein M1828_002694 [Chrysothrix sp. TS-e1954]
MSEVKLNQAIKGAPAPSTTVQDVAAAAATSPSHPTPSPSTARSIYESKKPNLNRLPTSSSDPTLTLPSSPPQIYMNLLILEASLRAQYLALRARRRQHTFFITLLFAWIATFSYLLFLRPREDGSGLGGSVYWVFDIGEKVGFMGGVLTAILIWGSGQWERGMRWPRRWIGITNRGLRGMNLKIVVLRGPWWWQFLSHLAFLWPDTSFFRIQGSSYHCVDVPDKRALGNQKHQYREGYQFRGKVLEDLAPGGDHLKLLLLPKPFSPEFRENWESFRTEYWEKENERRAELAQIYRKQQRVLAKQLGGWLWWTGWRGWIRREGGGTDVEKMQSQISMHNRQASLRRQGAGIINLQSAGSHSRSSSRSSTATPELEKARVIADRRAAKGSGRPGSAQRMYKDRTGSSSLSEKPVLNKRSSTISNASSSASDSERSSTISEYSGSMRRRPHDPLIDAEEG